MYPWIYTRAKEQPDELALITDTERLTWSALYTKAHKLASSWAPLLSRGERIALYGPSSTAYIVAIHAAQLLELTIVPINIRLSQSEVSAQLKQANVKYVISDRLLDSNVKRLPFHAPNQAPEILVRHMPKHYIQSMLFTSGTTGKPKAVEQTMLNHFSSAMNAARHIGSFPDDRFLVVTPLFHMSGLAVVYRSVIYGVPLILEPHFSPNKTMTWIKTEAVTHISLVSVMLDRLLEAGLRRHDLRVVLTGGGPVPLPILTRALDRDLPVMQTYGMTETASQIATLLPEDALRKIGSAGKPIAPTEIRITRHQEIEVKGPTVMNGYFNNPEATTAAFTADGYLKTGDLGRIDSDGYLYVLDRRSDLIISGGENVYPAEVEAALLSISGITEAGVVGRFDPTWGQVPVAFIVSQLEESSVRQQMEQLLAKYKCPVTYVYRDTLPRNANGKLIRRQLKESL
ncbi:o-succinylbenzoate--CoA ligase [Exiguobacterium antarcticum]|uniref:2-succinylbenzoate--CoA ligase n=1 Tax=Exiguobacterium antarcticum TaxID=132920 RepID=A0ABT6R4P8_9BACL|nr:o-succinylbenzoate--CoA ligase [Exiguobacterium antarcticum]AFS69750.1 2-succinylbenzoate--CoA ligase [Exiguobacterium antarcticum B7]MDI3235256.1 o-succinylbenzoate--CoA ligase [Exiguobacterium antarcticum]